MKHTYNFNGLTDIVDLAHGRITQNELAEKRGISASTYSAKNARPDLMEAVKTLSDKTERFWTDAEQARTELKQARTDAEQARTELERIGIALEQYKTDAEQARTDAERIRITLEQETNNAERLRQEVERLTVALERWDGQPGIIRTLASTTARTVMLFLLAAFEMVGSFNLLLPKGILLSLPVSVALGFSLLVFTAAEHKAGKWFSIAFSMAVGMIFFNLVDRQFSDWLFAFTPPIIAAIIAFTIRPNENGRI